MGDTLVDTSEPLGPVEIHVKVREIINTYFKGNKNQKKALDAASGNGYMTRWLIENGFDVVALDITNNNWKLPEVKSHYSDFNKRIEASDETFDLLVSIETIEHLENPFLFIRELSRVAKPGGIVIITTPNVHSIRSRLKYLFYGMPRLFEYIKNDNMGQHISPISIGQFLYAFRTSNLTIIDVFSAGAKPPFVVSMVFSLLNYCVLLSLRIMRAKSRVNSDHYLNILSHKQLKELNREGFLIVVAQKDNL